MTKTIHPLLPRSQNGGGEGRGGGRLFEKGSYFKFRPIGGALIRGKGFMMLAILLEASPL